MKNVFTQERFNSSNRWVDYHKEIFKFLTNFCALPDLEEEKNTKVIYSSPSSAYVKYISPLLNGQTETPMMIFILESEAMVSDIAPFIKPVSFNIKEGEDINTANYQHPIIKELTYKCNLYTNTNTQADIILTRLEMASNTFKPYGIKVNNKRSQVYMKDVNNDTQININVGDKRVITSSFVLYIPRAYIAPTEIITNVSKVDDIKTYIGLDGTNEEL